MKSSVDCQSFEANLPNWLPDLVFSPESVPAAASEHIRSCPPCAERVRQEQASVEGTLSLMDEWEAPEPSPYFAARMGALLREEQARPAAGLRGWWQRLRTGLVLTDVHLKPVLGGGALALALVAAGGGAYLSTSNPATPAKPTATQASPIVRDLQSLDENAPVFQQLSSIDTGEDNSGTL